MFKNRVKDHKYLSGFGGISSVYAATTTWRLGPAAMASTLSTDQATAPASALQASSDVATTSATAKLSGQSSDVASADSSATTTIIVPTAVTTSSEPARTVLGPEDASISARLSYSATDAGGHDEAQQSSDATPTLVTTTPAVTQTLRVAAVSATGAEPAATVSLLAAPAAAAVATPNKIALENMKQGNPQSEWGMTGDGSGTIQGFATQISTNIGQTVDFKIATDSTHYRIDIYRMGYYGGDGARKVASIDKSLTTAQIQPHPIVDMTLGLIDAGNWSVSASWNIPADAVSGVYFAKLVREDGVEDASIVPFVVRDDASTSNIVFQTSDTTWQAYNAWGGASLYYGEVPVDPNNMIGYLPPNCSCGLTAIGRASAVSYNRPIITTTSPAGGTHDFIFGAESAAISWLEQNGYDVSYISGVDATRSGSLLLNHDAFLSVGHDEYWSAEQRANVEAARDSGVNLAFWSGNEVYWKVRWETSIDGNGTPYRTMVSYKETWGTSSDPSNIGTGTWRDPRYADPGQQPENALTGTMFTVDSYRLDTITIPYDYSNLRFWRNTDVANLQPGQTYSLVQNLLGYEWDSDVENGFRPAGLVNLSLSSVSVDTYLRDYGTTIGSAVATHSLTMYRAASGALVFGAGTVFWSWGLSDNHEGAATPTDPNVQQAMVNMFADMGIQPTTLDASLVIVTQSTDTLKPTSTITSPTVGGSFLEGQHVAVTGTAQDFGGGIIAGVEVSVDGGQHWFKATGRENWSYNWVVQASGTYTIMSRAVDDSVNMEAPAAGKQVTVSLPSTVGLWTLAAKPAIEMVAEDRNKVELGVRFQSTTGGFVTGIRFYKGFYNIGEHVVSLWNANGTLLATGISTGESLSGWQTVTFSSPIAISAATTYIASYHSDGFYSATENYFGTTYSNGPLKIVDGGGVYSYSSTSGTLPINSSNGANYWVDVVFNAGANTAPVATDDSGYSVSRNSSITLSIASLVANDTDANGDSLTISAVGGAVNGSVVLNAQTGTIVFTPSANYSGSASFTYTLSDGRGGSDQGAVSLTVQNAPTGASLFQANEGPTTGGFSDNSPLELGMKFVSSTAGTITSIRFYKASGDTGAHTGSIWSSSGALLGTVSFSAESLSGWQTATFSTPIQITAGATYIASYHTTGTYVATANYFTQAHTNGILTGLSATTSGGNGVFSYGSSTTFPTSNYQASNYWVDVVFNQSTVNTAPIAANDNGFVAYSNTALSIAAATLLANDVDVDGDVLSITGATAISGGTVAFNSQTNAITFTPTTGYIGSASFRYTASDGRGGTSSAVVSLNVSQPGSTSATLFSASQTPSIAADNDPDSVELGVKFIASSTGQITGLRYYKSAQDTGTHTGTLWSSTGVLLATATFTNETASGWQTVSFAQPVTISAGTTYVASYHSNGFYAATPNYFTTTYTNGALSAPSGSNGVYAYGTGSLFPSATYNATNYWVDVVYQSGSQTVTNHAPVALNDNGFSTTTGAALTIQASALLANDTDSDGNTLIITGVTSGTGGSAVFNSQTNTITFTPTSGFTGAATFSYAISDGVGGVASATVGLTVTQPTSTTTSSLFSSSQTPSIAADNDPASVELGVKFVASSTGQITGLRYYKSAQDTGAHIGTLWSSTGTALASATFTNETASGWQTVSFAQPITISAGTTYVASYHSNGFYAATPNYFTTSYTNGALTAPSGSNGVYAYGTGSLFPSATYNATNYWVDVVYQSGPQTVANTAPVALNDSGYSTGTGTTLTIQASALLANDSDADGNSLTITGVTSGTGGSAVFNSQTNVVTFTPTAGFTGAANFSYAISDGAGGTASAQVSLTVNGQAPSQGAEQNLFVAGTTPTTVSVNDNNPVNLGMKFQADAAGWITGIRFYKGTNNTGAHTGYLWSATGTLLASATFTNETASGWQSVSLSNQVAITADTTYVVSYSTNGSYSATGSYFNSAGVTNGNLEAMSSALSGGNGVYAYGSAGLFPTSTYNSANYYVDVAFKPQLAA
jgi:hypothetical protein